MLYGETPFFLLILYKINAYRPYKEARNALYERTYKGSDSTPAVLNLARLAVLKKLAMDPSSKGTYDRRFREEAIKHGFSEKWIEEQLKNVNDLTYDDVKHNELFGSVKVEDMPHIGRLSEGVYQNLRKSPQREQLMLARYDRNLPNKDSLLLTQQAKIVAGRHMASAAELARRIDRKMKPQDLLTPAGIAKAHRAVVEGRLGADEDIRIVEAAWQKHQKGKALGYKDFAIYRPGRSSSADEYTRAARNANYTGIELSRQIEEETRSAGGPKPEKRKDANQGDTQGGGVLKDATIEKLNRVLEGLKGVLERWETQAKLNQQKTG